MQDDFDNHGNVTFELDGTAEGQFDRIDVSGDATLGGDVTIDVGGGFTPEAGDAFTVVDADDGASLAGDLDASVAGLPDDLGIDLSVEGSTIVAAVVDSADPDALA